MNSWRDDLPTIPGERIIDDAVQEGRRRARRQERRRRALIVGGFGAVAVVAVVVMMSNLVGRRAPDDDQLMSGTVMPAESAWAGTAPPVAETAVPPVGGEGIVVPAELFIAVSEVWELPPAGPACGPTEFVVTFEPAESIVGALTVNWLVGGSLRQSPMVVVDGIATATIGPFPSETLVDLDAQEIVVFVAVDDGSGTLRRSPSETSSVILRDCPG